jgi:hypothetical protein
VDNFDVRLTSVNEYNQKQNQISRHADNLVTLIAFRLSLDPK